MPQRRAPVLDDHLDATVLGAPLGIVATTYRVRRDRTRLAEAAGVKAPAVHAVAYERVGDAFRTRLRKSLIGGLAADRIGVAFD